MNHFSSALIFRARMITAALCLVVAPAAADPIDLSFVYQGVTYTIAVDLGPDIDAADAQDYLDGIDFDDPQLDVDEVLGFESIVNAALDAIDLIADNIDDADAAQTAFDDATLDAIAAELELAQFQTAEWALQAGGQHLQAEPGGAFRLSNIASPDFFGPGGPGTAPDFLSDDFLRVTGTAEIDGTTWYALSDPFQIRAGETFVIGDLRIGNIPPPLPESITLDVCPGCSPVLEPEQQTQLVTTARLGDGSSLDVTPRLSWSTYRTSNPAIATVSEDGLVSAHQRGTVFITAVNEAATATRRIDVVSAAIETTIAGVALREDGTPAAGAEITLLTFGGTTGVNSDGTFVLTAIVPAATMNLAITATLQDGDQQLLGSASGLTPVADAFTDAGVLVLKPLCEPTWAALGAGITGGFGSIPSVEALAVFDDGAGPAIYAAGFFSLAGGQTAIRIARWDGSAWSALGAGLGGSTINGGSARALAVFDDGAGPALYAGGSFTTAGGQPANRIARWNGSAWSPLGSGLGGLSSPAVNALAVFDDGSGPALYAGGSFTFAAGQPANYIARWDGSAWLPLGSGMDGGVSALTIFDDGSGLALYAGGSFTTAGGQPANRIARWDGSAWSPLGSGVGSAVAALTVFDDGLGPALYVGGSFTTAGGQAANRIARWDGSAWSPLGSGTTSSVFSLTVFDDGSGPALYAGGSFTSAGGQAANRIARWDGVGWSPVGSGTSGNSVPWINALTVFDDGSGPALYAGGDFTTAGGQPANRIAKWGRDCTERAGRLRPEPRWGEARALSPLAPSRWPGLGGGPGVTAGVPAPGVLAPAPALSHHADGTPRSVLARAVSARVLSEADAEALLARAPDPLTNAAGQRVVTRADAEGRQRVFLIEADGRERVLPTLGGESARGEALSALGDVVGMSQTGDGRIEGFVWRGGDGSMASIGTLGGPGSASLLWFDTAVVVGDADDGAPAQRAAFWAPGDGLTDLNWLVEPGSGLVLREPRAVLPGGVVLVEAERVVAGAGDARAGGARDQSAGAPTPRGERVLVELVLEFAERAPGDLNADGTIDLADVTELMALMRRDARAGGRNAGARSASAQNSGEASEAPRLGDLNADGLVDWADLELLVARIGG